MRIEDLTEWVTLSEDLIHWTRNTGQIDICRVSLWPIIIEPRSSRRSGKKIAGNPQTAAFFVVRSLHQVRRIR